MSARNRAGRATGAIDDRFEYQNVFIRCRYSTAIVVDRRSSSRFAAVVVCLVLVSPLTGGVLGAATGPGTATGTVDTATATELDAVDDTPVEHPLAELEPATRAAGDDADEIRIDDDIPDTGDDVEIVVRLEEAPVSDVDPDRLDDRLEEHADDTQEPLLEYAADAPAIDVEERFWLTNAVVLEVDAEAVDLETFERFDAVEAVHENFAVSVPEPRTQLGTTERTSDASAATGPSRTTGAIARLNVPAVWNAYETRGAGTRVAVLDTGIDPDHPALELYTDDPSDPTYPGGWAEFDATGDRVANSTPHDTGTHGTHVSGTVAGVAPDGTAIGVAPEADLLHGLVLNGGDGTFAQIVAGMEWALEEDADVISMSLGSTGAHAPFIDPVRNARASGAVVVGAIGNEGAGTSGSPGNVYETISVGASAGDDSVAAFSGGGRINRTDWATAPETWPDEYVVPTVVAPGVDVVSTVPDGGYARMPGTSMATPHVSGTIALLLSIDPGATPTELSTALTETAWKPEGDVKADDSPAANAAAADTRYGHGIVDAEAAAGALVDRTEASRDSSRSDSVADSETDASSGDARLESAGETDGGATPLGVVWIGRVATVGLAAIVGAVAMLVVYGYGAQQGRDERP